jgi:hypothetical protein
MILAIIFILFFRPNDATPHPLRRFIYNIDL